MQIRTEEMHRLAEEGIAAHWKYKEGRVGAGRDEQYFQWLRQLLEWQQEVRDPQEFLANLKIDLYPEEVYTFTPRGTVKVLPKGSTAIDFAYAIHTDVGHQCVGARVNGRMVPLRTSLKNGDIVEIIRNAAHKPSRDWLNFAVTSRARNKIKHLIQAEEKERAVELGRKVFDKEARRFGLNGTKLLEGEALAKVAGGIRGREAGGPARADRLRQGLAAAGARQARAAGAAQGAAARAPGGLGRQARAAPGAEPDRIKVRGADDLMVFRARCCNPIRGEQIVGYITRGKGVSVHSAKCTNVINLMYDPERRIDVEWDKGADTAPYTVRLTIEVEDRKGMLAELSSQISDINTNITNLEARTGDQRGRIDMTVEIKDMKHLEKVIKSIRGIAGVLNVERKPESVKVRSFQFKVEV